MKPPALRRCAPPAAVTPGLTAAPAGALQAQETTVRMWFIHVTRDPVLAMTMGERIVVMHAGEAARIGTLQVVCLTPASLPVARTTGSPAMKLLPGRAQSGAEARTLSGTGWFVAISADAAAHAVQALANADVVLGIRPEALDLGPDAGAGEPAPAPGSIPSMPPPAAGAPACRTNPRPGAAAWRPVTAATRIEGPGSRFRSSPPAAPSR